MSKKCSSRVLLCSTMLGSHPQSRFTVYTYLGIISQTFEYKPLSNVILLCSRHDETTAIVTSPVVFRNKFSQKSEKYPSKQRSFSVPLIDTYGDDSVSWETSQRRSFQRRIHSTRRSLVQQKGTTKKKKRVKSHTYVQIIPILKRVVFNSLLVLEPCSFSSTQEENE